MMKRIVAVSDSHGDAAGLKKALELAAERGRIDAVVFLGDGASDFEAVCPSLMAQGIACHAVRGNNDWSGGGEREAVFTVNGVRFLACHGHTLHVKYGLDRLWYAAQEREAQVVLYGHTHREKIDLEHGMQFVNPGAVCERYGKNRSAYAEILVDDKGYAQPFLRDWE